jgi:hypothetical protein
VWELLSWAGPGDGFKQLREEFVALGGDKGQFDVWYDTSGEWAYVDSPKAQEEFKGFAATLQTAATSLGLERPTGEELVEYSNAYSQNEQFRQFIQEGLGPNFYDVLAEFGMSTKERREEMMDKDDRLEEYFDRKDFYAKENQLWAKYYHINEYEGGVGIPGLGGEAREPSGQTVQVGSSSGRSSARRSQRSGSGGRGNTGNTFVPMGYRSSMYAKDLFDPEILGSGGVGGSPFWPTGFGARISSGVQREIIKRSEDGKPLSSAAKEQLVSIMGSPGVTLDEDGWQEYIDWLTSLVDDEADVKPIPKTPWGGGSVKPTFST